MNEHSASSGQDISDWRLKLGIVLFIISLALPLLGIPATASLKLSTAMAASVTGGLLIGAEALGLIAVAVMGKSGFAFIKNRVFGFIKQHGPPQDVSRRRYSIGLVLFSIPIIFAWMSIYFSGWFPGYIGNPMPYAIGGDLLLLCSLIVLGGNFWDKIRALFIHDAKVDFR